MAENNNVLNQLKLLNEKLSLNQKVSMIAFAVAIAIGVTYLAVYMNQEEYQTLYSNLNSEEAGTVINRLKDSKTPYTLADGGKTVRVPADKLDELRIQLASEGLPQSGKIGFEIFDKTNLGMTEFLEKVSYKRALEGELSRTILSLKEISQARVHLVLPKESLFQEKSESTKASVVIKCNAGKVLSESMVSGIVHLVSSAVEGLSPQSVTVVDVSGRLLSSKMGSTEEMLTGTQLELKARTEKELTAKVINILEPVVGEGRVKADASVVLNLNRSEATLEQYDPNATAVRSSQKNSEESQPIPAPAAAGVPGTQSNQATPAPNFIPLGGRGGSSFSKQSETMNYEVTKLVRRTIDSYGDTRKISVAVIVDDALKTDKDPQGNPIKKTEPRTAEELKKIRDLVTATLGIDPGRGDLLTVENIAFDNPYRLEEIKPTSFERWRHLLQPAIKYVSLLLLFLLVYFLLIRPVQKKLFSAAEQILTPEAKTALEGAESGGLALESPRTVKELEASLGNDINVLLAPAEVRKSDIFRQRIVEFIQREPEAGAQVVRVWLNEELKQ